MTTSQISGIHFGINSGVVTFFGTEGMKFGNNKFAMRNSVGAFKPVSNSSLLPVICELIKGCAHKDRVSMILLGANLGVALGLEGVLTREHLEKATGGAEYVDVPGVEIDGRDLVVRVLREPEYDISTADSDGVRI